MGDWEQRVICRLGASQDLEDALAIPVRHVESMPYEACAGSDPSAILSAASCRHPSNAAACRAASRRPACGRRLAGCGQLLAHSMRSGAIAIERLRQRAGVGVMRRPGLRELVRRGQFHIGPAVLDQPRQRAEALVLWRHDLEKLADMIDHQRAGQLLEPRLALREIRVPSS